MKLSHFFGSWLMLDRFYQVIKTVVPAKYLDDKTIYHLQPSGRFVIGGPQVTITRKLLISYKKQIYNLKSHFSLLIFPSFFCPTGWCWCDRQEDHCRHIWRVGSSRGRCFLWQRLLKGGPLSCLRCSLGGQVSGQSQTLQESSGSGVCAASFIHWPAFEL